jgi:glycosyltransferase involved in cell wall biosynthesis
MRILALEPYYGGSHQAFLDGWSATSRHEWAILSLPAYKWKWRMRHAAVTFADETRKLTAQGQMWDALFCSDMLNLAEFLGLAPVAVGVLPSVAYFHESQLTYPVRVESERDYQFAMTNLTTALAADSVWFNSVFHRDSFLEALRIFLQRMPDHQPTEAIARIEHKACVHHPGICPPGAPGARGSGPLRILWAARWEHDKNPDTFFAALKRVKAQGVPFRLSVIGEQFRDTPGVFAWAREYFADHIDRWGYQRTREEYSAALRQADVFVATAEHEFFGLSAVEAVLAGAYPVLPERLAYPEVFGDPDIEGAAEFFYDGSTDALADRLIEIGRRARAGGPPNNAAAELRRRLKAFTWPNCTAELDDAIERVRSSHPSDESDA